MKYLICTRVSPNAPAWTASDGKPICLCVTYPWSRSLDGNDHTRNAQVSDENPGVRVVSLSRMRAARQD